MAICNAEPVGLGLEVESLFPAPSSAAGTRETLSAKLHNLKLEENPEPKSDEGVSPKAKKESEEESGENLVPLREENYEEKDQVIGVNDEEKREEKREEKDQEVDVVEEEKPEEKEQEDNVDDEKLEKDLEQSYEVKADGWGWDQDFTAPEGNQKFEENPEWTSEEKVEAWGWDQEAGGSEGNAKCEKGSESLKEEKGQKRRSPLLQRSNELDCSFFVKTGTCRFGLNCKFNHPPSRMRSNKV